MPKTKISVKDKRTIDPITGKQISDTGRMHADIPESHLTYVVKKAKEYGIDPYTALAINLQETRFSEKHSSNPFEMLSIDSKGDVVDQSLKFMKEKFELGRRLGKKTEEEIIQSWNGYGVIKDNGTMYGIDTSKSPINMKENPVYGKRIINLRDSVIKQHPDIVKKVEEAMSAKQIKAKKSFKNGGEVDGKRTVLVSKMNKEYDDNLSINNAWMDSLKKANTEEELYSTPVGTYKGNPLLMKDFAQMPEFVRNYYRPEYAIEYNKKRLGLPNTFDEINHTASSTLPGPRYQPASTISPKNNLAYYSQGGLKTSGRKLKAKKMVDGGIKPVAYDNLRVPTLGVKPSTTNLQDTNNPLANSGGGEGVNPAGAILDEAANIIPSILNSAAPQLTDARENPGEILKTRDSLSTAADVTGSTLKGASTGLAVAGPVGALVGGAAGLVTSGVQALIGSKRKKEERKKAVTDWANDWSSKYSNAYSANSYKDGGPVLTTGLGRKSSTEKGGKIEGPGTGTSDSIPKNIEDGSFVVPAKNAEKALNIGREYLDWNGEEMASRNYPGTEVKVSNGEVIFTPEEVNILSYNGVDLNALAPKAETKLKEGAELKNGFVPDRNPLQNTGFINERMSQIGKTVNVGEDPSGDLIPANIQTSPDGTPQGEESYLDRLAKYIPEIAGAVQVAAGTAGLMKAGRMPDINVSTSLKELAAEQRKEAEYGLEPGAKAAMKIASERQRRNATNALVGRGGSAAELTSNLQGIMSTAINEGYQIELSDAAEKARKKGEAARTRQMIGEQQYDIQKIGLNNWKEMQDINANLLSAGISNIVGARKLKAEMDSLNEIKKRGQIDWSQYTV